MSAGVCIQRRISRVNRAVSAVTAMATSTDRYAALATQRRMARISPAPNSCATGMAKPMHAPCTKPKIKKLIEPVLPTAANAFTPMYWPTMMLSAML